MSQVLHKFLHWFVLFAIAATMSATTLTAQEAKPSQNAAKAPAIASVPSTAPDAKNDGKTPLTPPPGKLRGLTNPMRWEAAKRTAARRAHAHVPATVQPNQAR